MALPVSLVHTLTTATSTDAWTAIFAHAWDICAEPLSAASAPSTVARRDREIASLDLFLASAGWDLWESLETAVEQTAGTLAAWWAGQTGGRAVLILDALSLRELPWTLVAGRCLFWMHYRFVSCPGYYTGLKNGATRFTEQKPPPQSFRRTRRHLQRHSDSANALRLRTMEPEARIDYPERGPRRLECLGQTVPKWSNLSQTGYSGTTGRIREFTTCQSLGKASAR